MNTAEIELLSDDGIRHSLIDSGYSELREARPKHPIILPPVILP